MDTCTHAVLGPTLERLSAVDPRLAGTFYEWVTASLRPRISLWDYWTTGAALEIQADSYQQMCEETPEHLHHTLFEEEPEDLDLPDYLQYGAPKLTPSAAYDIARGAADPLLVTILAYAERLADLCRTLPEPPHCNQVHQSSHFAPPILLLSYARFDQITAYYDREVERSWYGATRNEPFLVVPFDPSTPDSIASAFETFDQLLTVLDAVSALIDILPDAEPGR